MTERYASGRIQQAEVRLHPYEPGDRRLVAPGQPVPCNRCQMPKGNRAHDEKALAEQQRKLHDAQAEERRRVGDQ